MTGRRSTALLLAALLVGAAGCGEDDEGGTEAAPVASVKTVTERAPEPARAAARPRGLRPGEVRVADGPFTDRLGFAGLTVRDGRLQGRVTQTADVSEVLALQLRADFYDREGNLVGSKERSWNGHLEPIDHDDEALRFTIDPRARGARSAVLSVVDYVPE